MLAAGGLLAARLLQRSSRSQTAVARHEALRAASTGSILQGPARLQGADTGTAPASAGAPGLDVPQLHSLVCCREGDHSFASATVTFGGSSSGGVSDAGQPTHAVLQHAAKVCLLALRAAHGSLAAAGAPPASLERPSCVLAFAPPTIPPGAVQAALQAVAEHLPEQTAIAGCSTRLWQPDELANAGGSTVAATTSNDSDGSGGSAQAATAAASQPQVPAPQRRQHHLTLASAHLPGFRVQALHSEAGSLPALPHLAEALAGTLPPTFVVFACRPRDLELAQRLENLFPGSCIAAAAARNAATPGSSSSPAGVWLRTASAEPTIPGLTIPSPPDGKEHLAAYQWILLENFSGGRSQRSSAPNADGAATDGNSTLAAATAAATAAAASAGAPPHELMPPIPVMFEGCSRAHITGCLTLAICPDPQHQHHAGVRGAAGRQASAAAGAPAALPALPAAARTSLARVLLGGELFTLLTLTGDALEGISPPPTGSESRAPPEDKQAHENPYYWRAARPLPVHYAVTLGGTAAGGRRRTSLASSPLSDQQQPPTLMPTPGQAAQSEQQAQQQGQVQRHVASAVAEASAEALRSGRRRLMDGPSSAGDSGPQPRDTDDALPGAAAGGPDAAEGDGDCVPRTPEGVVGLQDLPLFPLDSVVLFPGQTTQLRIFEKRYQLLVRAALEQGAAFGISAAMPAAPGQQGRARIGATAVVRSYQTPEPGSDMLVLLEGGTRFMYEQGDLGVIPSSFGLNVVRRAELLVDDPPSSEEDALAVMDTARQIINTLAGALHAASAEPAARAFANALHLASASTPAPQGNATAGTPTDAAPGAAATTAAAIASLDAAEEDAAEAAASLAADLAEAKAALDVETASMLSLYLAPYLPLQNEAVRRGWFTSRDALWRLQQQLRWLTSSSQTVAAVAAEVLRLRRDHPLRIMLGLSRVAMV